MDGAKPAQAQIDVVRPDRVSERLEGGLDRRQRFLGAGRGAQHRIRMTDDVLGRRLDRDVDAVLEGVEEHAAGPGVVHQHDAALLVSFRGDRRDVLDLEGAGARRLRIDDLGIGPDQVADAAADQRIVIGGLDPHALQEIVAEPPVGEIGGVDHQDVVAGLHEGEDGADHGGEARREGDGAVAAFHRRHRLAEGAMGRRAVAPVHVALEVGLVRVVPGGDAGKGDGGGVIDGRIDDTVVRLRIEAGMRDHGVAPVGALGCHHSLRERSNGKGAMVGAARFRRKWKEAVAAITSGL